MSRNLRPTIELWGDASPCFVESPENVIETIALEAGCEVDEYEEGECIALYIHDPLKFLAYLERLDSDSFVARYEGDAAREELLSLIRNLKVLTPDWYVFVRKSPDKTSMRLLID